VFEIRFDEAKIKQVERQLRGIPRALPKVMTRGLNRTATEARTKTSRLIAAESGMRVGDVRKNITLIKANYAHWRSAVRISRKRVSLRYLNPRQTSRGLSVKAGRKRITLRRAFSALKGWFIRQPEGGGYAGVIGARTAWYWEEGALVGRLPISRIRGPVLSQIFEGAQAEANRIHRESMARLEKNIHDQVRLILQRRAG
jgi:hypothetical protein